MCHLHGKCWKAYVFVYPGNSISVCIFASIYLHHMSLGRIWAVTVPRYLLIPKRACLGQRSDGPAHHLIGIWSQATSRDRTHHPRLFSEKVSCCFGYQGFKMLCDKVGGTPSFCTSLLMGCQNNSFTNTIT